MSTHILEEAEQLADRIVLMAEGRVVADAPTRALTDDTGRLAPEFVRLTRPAGLTTSAEAGAA